MVKEIGGILPGPLKSLYRVLNKWNSLMQDSEWEKNDVPWWYNERALLSLLAGAIWKSGGWAFEEFVTSKRMVSKRGRHGKGAGRGDIMFEIGQETFIAEAKQCWPILGYRNHSAINTVKKALREARIQSSRLPSEGKKLGIVFAVPRLHESKQRDSEKILHNFVSRFRAFKNTTISWVFPKGRRTSVMDEDGYIYPGIALMLKLLRFRKKS